MTRINDDFDGEPPGQVHGAGMKPRHVIEGREALHTLAAIALGVMFIGWII